MTTRESFWDFSLRVYADDAVQRACLQLQEANGADVNVLLFCCWAAATRGRMADADRDAVLALSQCWSGNVVRPLRAVRSWMKAEGCADPRIDGGQCLQLREKIKRAELAAEKLQQQALETLSARFTPAGADEAPIDAAIANLRGYFAAADRPLDERARRDLAVILAAAFDRPRVDEVFQAL